MDTSIPLMANQLDEKSNVNAFNFMIFSFAIIIVMY